MLTPGEEDKARAVLLEIASGHDAQTRSAVLPNDAKSLEEGLNGPLSDSSRWCYMPWVKRKVQRIRRASGSASAGAITR